MRVDFTKRKFLALPPQQQHKKCAEIIRLAYDSALQNTPAAAAIAMYSEIAGWMAIDPVDQISMQSLSDLYHMHASHAEMLHKEHRLLPQVKKHDRQQSEASWGLSIYLDNLRSAHNVGSILRTTEAFAMGKVYFSPSTPFATHKQVQDAAMGSVKWVECFQNTSLDSLPRPIIALETASSSTPIFDFPFPKTFTLAVGNEEYGCSDSTLQIADAIVEIPMRGHKNSLNVANCFAIALFAFFRRFY